MISKKFNKTYDDALTQANLFYSEFVADQSLFEAFSPKFGTTYADDFLALITAADDIRTNQDDLDAQTAITTDLETKVDSYRQHYQKLLLHVSYAWPGDAAKLKVFGKNFFDEARNIPAKMVNLLQDAYRDANSSAYKAALIAAGFIEADIMQLNTLANDLQNKLYEQQAFIRHATTRAEERAIAFNKLWDIMVQINGAAKLIFVDSPAKTAYYMLYPEGPGPGSLTAPENLTVDVSTMTFSVDPVPNAVSYQFEMAVAGSPDFEVIYSGPENYFIYTPPASGLRSFRARCHNAGGYSEYSLLMVYNHVVILPPPSYVSASIVDPLTGEVALNWGEVSEATYYKLFKSTVSLGSEPAEFILVGQYEIASYSGTETLSFRYYYKVIAGNLERESVASDAVYLDM